MFSLELTLLGLALAIDAAVVTFAISLLHEDHGLGEKTRYGFMVASVFGLFQFLMLWLGSYAGFLFTFSAFGYYFQFAVGIIFFALAVKCIQESVNNDERKIEWGIIPVLILALATSIDALVSGISLGTIPQPHISALAVGIITFVICGLFYLLGQFFKKVPEKWLLRLAAIIFFVLAGQVFWPLRRLLGV